MAPGTFPGGTHSTGACGVESYKCHFKSTNPTPGIPQECGGSFDPDRGMPLECLQGYISSVIPTEIILFLLPLERLQPTSLEARGGGLSESDSMTLNVPPGRTVSQAVLNV